MKTNRLISILLLSMVLLGTACGSAARPDAVMPSDAGTVSAEPAACMAVTGKSNDGTVPFENGVRRIYYNIPPEEFAARQAEFETLIEALLNSVLEPDDTEFEKSLKLYAYMAANFTYGDITIDGEGFTYTALRNKQGICEHLSAVYTYLLL